MRPFPTMREIGSKLTHYKCSFNCRKFLSKEEENAYLAMFTSWNDAHLHGFLAMTLFDPAKPGVDQVTVGQGADAMRCCARPVWWVAGIYNALE
jgi:hypothetical protein